MPEITMKSHQKYNKNDIKIYTSVRIKDHERKERAATPWMYSFR